MQVNEALEFADEWSKDIQPGADGWRTACATLAAEVRRLRVKVGAGETAAAGLPGYAGDNNGD